jgi:hypothetical protein
MEENNHRKSKEELQQAKKLNRSMIYLSKATQRSIGVSAVQEEKGVFGLSNGNFLKIYSVKFSGDINKDFIPRLCKITTNRIRLSSFYKCTNKKFVSYLFLSVYFEAETYADVDEQIKFFENKLFTICQPLNINIISCTFYNILSIVHMNSTGKMKQFNRNMVLARNCNWEKLIFPDLKTNCGEFEFMDKSGLCFLGKIFPDRPIDIKKELLSLSCNFQIALDIQKISVSEKDMFKLELENKYECSLPPVDTENIINVSYLLTLIPEQNQNLSQLKIKVMNLFDQQGMLIVPCVNREKEVFQSIASMGIVNFHSMKNADIGLTSSLYI